MLRLRVVLVLERELYMESTPAVSFIVPVYNVEHMLARCLDTLVGQTLSDIEVIVVNDGSPDNSQAIIDDYAERYPEIIRAYVKENGGLSDARNFGLERAKGEFVAFVDSDDWVSKELAEKTVRTAREREADIVCYRFFRVSGDEQKIAKNPYLSEFFLDSYSVLETPKILLAAKPYAWNRIYKRSLFAENGIEFPVGQKYEDSATTYNLMLAARGVAFLNEMLYYYVVDRPDSITNTVDEGIYDIFKSIESFRTFYESRGALDTCREELDEITRMLISARLIQTHSLSDERFVYKFIDTAYEKLNAWAPDWNTNQYYELAKPNASTRQKYLYMQKSTPEGYKVHWHRCRENIAGGQPKVSSSKRVHKSLQDTLVEILLTIDQVCAENGLTYYLTEGSLLGAMRHSGFVPWDDDIDVMMPREDYEKFIQAFGTKEINECVMLNEHTYPKYHLTFTKICTLKKTGLVNRLDPLPRRYSGPSVDIFPLDHGVESEPRSRTRAIRYYRDALLYKIDYMKPNGRSFMRQLPYYLKWLYSFSFLHKKVDKLYTKHNSRDTGYLANYASSYKINKETFPAEWFEGERRVPFEGHSLPVPAEAEKVLTTIYKNWRKLPPKRKRTPRHSMDFDPKFDPRVDSDAMIERAGE